MRIRNLIDEYLNLKQFPDMKDAVIELKDVNNISSIVISGNFVLFGYTKTIEEFKIVVKRIMKLMDEGLIVKKDVEDSLLVVMANFYDIVIDCPNPDERLEALFEEWKEIVSEDIKGKCKKCVAEIKAKLKEDYEKK